MVHTPFRKPRGSGRHVGLSKTERLLILPFRFKNISTRCFQHAGLAEDLLYCQLHLSGHLAALTSRRVTGCSGDSSRTLLQHNIMIRLMNRKKLEETTALPDAAWIMKVLYLWRAIGQAWDFTSYLFLLLTAIWFQLGTCSEEKETNNKETQECYKK